MARDREDFRRGYKRLAPVYGRGLGLYSANFSGDFAGWK
jgi:hypothetical protein